MGTAILDTALGDYDSASTVSRGNSSEGEATETLPTGGEGRVLVVESATRLSKVTGKKLKSQVLNVLFTRELVSTFVPNDMLS